MKHLLPITLLCLLLLLFSLYYLISHHSFSLDLLEINPPSPTASLPTPSPATQIIDYQQQSFSYHHYQIQDPSKLQLISNYSKRLSSTALIKQHTCHFLVNGGFYTPDHQPLGLFITSGQTLNPSQTNQLLNGFLSSTSSVLSLTTSPPSSPVDFALQSGPLLLFQGRPTSLSLARDEPRRRLVAALDNQNQLHFLVFYSPDQLFGGPYLKDLGGLLVAVSSQDQLNLKSALNLDGGSASTYFLHNNLFLQEFEPIGSFFCYSL